MAEESTREYWEKRISKRHENIVLRVTREEKERISQLAKDTGKSISDVIREALFTGHEMPSILWEALIDASQALHLPVSTLITHILIRRFAFDGAWFEKFGPSKQIWKEFYFEDSQDGTRRLVTGMELLDALRDDYERLFDEFRDSIKQLEGNSGDTDLFVNRFRDFVGAH